MPYYVRDFDLVTIFSRRADALAEYNRVKALDFTPPEDYEMGKIKVPAHNMKSYTLARQRIKVAKARLARAEKKAADAALSALLSESFALFRKFPELQYFAWRQYINDCDCPFCEAYAVQKGDVVERADPEVHGMDGRKLDGGRGSEIQSHVAGFLCKFDDRHLFSTLGVDVRVSVHRDGKIVIEHE